MYNKINDLSLINKFLFLLVFIPCFIFVQNIYIFIILMIILLLLAIFSKIFNAIDLIVIAGVLMFFKSTYAFIDIIIRVILVIAVIYVFITLLKRKEKRTILEKMFYHNPKMGKKIINSMYRKKIRTANKEKYVPFKSLLTPFYQHRGYINAQINKKTDEDVNDVYLLSRLRFYNYYSTRTNIKKNKWKPFDNTALLVLVFVVIIVIIWR